jgi:hypothetical protein
MTLPVARLVKKATDVSSSPLIRVTGERINFDVSVVPPVLLVETVRANGQVNELAAKQLGVVVAGVAGGMQEAAVDPKETSIIVACPNAGGAHPSAINASGNSAVALALRAP